MCVTIMKGQYFHQMCSDSATTALFAPSPITLMSLGCAMAQAVNRCPLTAESRFRALVNPCGICDGQSGTGTGFSLELFSFLLSILFRRHSPYSYI
jgi:hypothetical protein